MNTYRYTRSDSLKCGVLVTIITLLESNAESIYIIVKLEGSLLPKSALRLSKLKLVPFVLTVKKNKQ